MDQTKLAESPVELKTPVEAPLNKALSQKRTSVFVLIFTVALRILGIRKKNSYEHDIERMTAMQVGYACALAFITFTAIMGLLCMAVVKFME